MTFLLTVVSLFDKLSRQAVTEGKLLQLAT
ncbi:hypothetical protein ABH915_001146 [Arthrobacter sp. MW3 TE3886]